MIIFNLDGTLADCEHRRHYVHKSHLARCMYCFSCEDPLYLCKDCEEFYKDWKPDWKSFYEACDRDKPNEHVLYALRKYVGNDRVQIWTGRCESVKEKTIDWLENWCPCLATRRWFFENLKMRPIGNNEPECDLKNRWLIEHNTAIRGSKDPIEFVFESQPDSIHMWKRHGIFVFDCSQRND